VVRKDLEHRLKLQLDQNNRSRKEREELEKEVIRLKQKLILWEHD
jgi:hypothetical protein